jgi:hypothetical protein
MNRFWILIGVVIGGLLLPASLCRACTPPNVYVYPWLCYVPVGDHFPIGAGDCSYTFITEWLWDWSPGLYGDNEIDGYGYDAYSGVRFISPVPGQYYVTVNARNEYDKTDPDPPTGTVYVVGVSELDIEYAPDTWDDVTDRTIAVLKGTIYKFEAWPDHSDYLWPGGYPTWTLDGSPYGVSGYPYIGVAFTTTGTHTIRVACGTSYKTVTIDVVEPTVYQFGVDGDHPMYQTPSTFGGWGEGTVAIVDPIYVGGSKNDPFCVSKHSDDLSLTQVKLTVPEPLTYPTGVRLQAAGSAYWASSSTFNFVGTLSDETTLHQDPIIPIVPYVYRYQGNFEIDWEYQVPFGTGAWYSFETTQHTAFITFDTPICNITPQRANWACGIASFAYTITGAACKFSQALADDPGFPGYFLAEDPWFFLSSEVPGDCITLAKTAAAGLDVIGIPNAATQAWPTRDNIENMSSDTCKFGPVVETFPYGGYMFTATLIFHDPDGWFEGFFVVNDEQGEGNEGWTVYPPDGPSTGTYIYLEAYRSAASDQWWVWDSTQTKGTATVHKGEPVEGQPHVEIPVP